MNRHKLEKGLRRGCVLCYRDCCLLRFESLILCCFMHISCSAIFDFKFFYLVCRNAIVILQMFYWMLYCSEALVAEHYQANHWMDGSLTRYLCYHLGELAFHCSFSLVESGRFHTRAVWSPLNKQTLVRLKTGVAVWLQVNVGVVRWCCESKADQVTTQK